LARLARRPDRVSTRPKVVLQEELRRPSTLIAPNIVSERNQAELDGPGDGLSRAAPDLCQGALGFIVQAHGASGHVQHLVGMMYY
jgi:hypothetical protein